MFIQWIILQRRFQLFNPVILHICTLHSLHSPSRDLINFINVCTVLTVLNKHFLVLLFPNFYLWTFSPPPSRREKERFFADTDKKDLFSCGYGVYPPSPFTYTSTTISIFTPSLGWGGGDIPKNVIRTYVHICKYI